MDKTYGNALLIYGGGLCDSANAVMRKNADKLVETQLFSRVFIGFNSFEAMLNPSFIKEWGHGLCQQAELAHGGFFGTCRDVWLTDPKLHEEAVSIMKAMGIQWIFVCGGDGSARNCAEISGDFEKEGIKIGFVLPCTVDGIEGSRSIGIRPAVRASIDIIDQLVSTCLNTRTKFTAPGLVVELQGRNRDDILANVIFQIELCKFDHKTLIFAIPANYEWNMEHLVNQVNNPENEQIPVLILVSEGATNKLISRFDMKTFEFIQKQFNRKTRTFEIGHLTQMNGQTDEDDMAEIDQMIAMAFEPMKKAIEKGKSFSVAYTEKGATIEDINYYQVLNPRNGQHPKLPKAVLEEHLLKYIP